MKRSNFAIEYREINTMNTNEAMNTLNIEGVVTQKDIKKAYKSACIKYHPDKNAAGTEIMKAINAAYDLLKKLGDSVEMSSDFKAYDFGEKLNEALNRLIKLDGITIEICSNWIWVSGDTKVHSKVLGRKEGGIGLFYASKKKCWYFRPEEYKSNNRSNFTMDQIRDNYGSVQINKENMKPKAISA
jgi:curved DNA-binding protein CbpA